MFYEKLVGSQLVSHSVHVRLRLRSVGSTAVALLKNQGILFKISEVCSAGQAVCCSLGCIE